MPSLEEINNYYEFSKWDYRAYNASFSNLSMHYGLWGQGVHTHKQALSNENLVVADVVGVSAKDYVIDLGCGYGATAVWLASNIGCKVLGISLSREQVASARQLARNHHVSHLVEFSTMDFHKLQFPAATFDVAIAIESISHSSKKQQVLKEILRVLKPGGRLSVADGFFAKRKDMITPAEQKIANACFEGVCVPSLPEKQEFERWLREVGFSRVRWMDKTALILPTAKRVYRLGKSLLPVSRLLAHLGVRAFRVSHMRAFINQYFAFRDGLGAYGIFTSTRTRANLPRRKKVESRARSSFSSPIPHKTSMRI
jgi:tocopherol O-methyltransferase